MTAPRQVVVAGASGFVGGRLLPALEALGCEVRCGSRDPSRHADGRRWVTLDIDSGAGLADALRGADTLFFLVHHLGAADAELAEREEAAARRVLAAAEAAGLRRIVYLGGPVPSGPSSVHLRGRQITGEVLRSGAVSTIELRASMIVGPGSASWELCCDLALRLPILVLPGRLVGRTQPVGIDDVVAALVAAITLPVSGSAAFDLPGPDVLAPAEILRRVAAQAGFRPVVLPVPGLAPTTAIGLLRLVTRADVDVVRQLVEGMEVDLLASDAVFWDRLPGLEPAPFEACARRALAADTRVLGAVSRAWESGVRTVARKVRAA